MRFQRPLGALALCSLCLNLFAGISPAQTPTSQTKSADGLVFALREAAASTPAPVVQPDVRPLDGASVQSVTDRLPPFLETTADQSATAPVGLRAPNAAAVAVPLNLRETGPKPVVDKSKPLEVVRYSPSGATSITTELSVTFSQPMVAVGSQTEAATIVPVKLTPEVRGRWRWIGTRTIVFDTEERFPMATEFKAAIPAGTRSLSGAVLPAAVEWNFSTPRPSPVSVWPGSEAVGPTTLIIARFNQRIDEAEILTKTSVTADGRPVAVRPATEAEIGADTKTSGIMNQAQRDRFAIFRPVAPLPLDASVEVSFAAGIRSLEGKLESASSSTFKFRTYGPFRLADSGCGWRGSGRCLESGGISLRFSNPIERESFENSSIVIEPSAGTVNATVYSDEVSLNADFKAGKTYRITVLPKLKDTFGQVLEAPATAKFKFGREEVEAGMFAPDGDRDVTTLDPYSRKHSFAVYARRIKRLRLRLYSVAPSAFGEYRKWLSGERASAPSIGRLVQDRELKVKGPSDSFNEVRIDLAPALTDGIGHVLIVIERPGAVENGRIVSWIQATQLATEAYVDRTAATLYVSDLKDGKAAGEVDLELSTGATARTAADGIATLPLPRSNDRGDYLIARRGADSAILFADEDFEYDADWMKGDQADSFRWHVFDDRGIYRPGETVSIKGYARRVSGGVWAEIESLGGSVRTAAYELVDSRSAVVKKGTVEFNAFGAFDLEVNLPKEINLGTAKIVFRADSGNSVHAHTFKVEEFRRPEYELTVKPDSPAPYTIGRSASVAVDAKYYSGGALPGAEVLWTVTATPTSYTPPNRSEFTFGEFVPWWSSRETEASAKTERLAAKTDANGSHRLALDFLDSQEPRPYSLTVEARVTDVNRQAISGSAAMIVHPSDIYVGLRTSNSFVEPNQSFKLESIVTDVDGRAVPGIPVSIVAELKSWATVKGRWERVTVATETCRVVSLDNVSECGFNAPTGGEYEFTATAEDARGRRNQTKMTVWVAGAEFEPMTDVRMEEITLIPGKQSYDVGETAEVLVNSPVFPAEGVMTLRRAGIVGVERFRLESASTVLKIPITDRYVPNLTVQVDVFGTGKRAGFFEDERDKKLPPRPANASGTIGISVSNATRRLEVAAKPRDAELAPGGETEIDIEVKDHRGRGVANSEVALVAVDESVLALTGYRIGNPLDSFYQPVGDQSVSVHSRNGVILAGIEDLLDKRDLDGLGFGRGFGIGDGSGMGNGYGSGGGNGSGDFNSYEMLMTSREADTPFRRLEILANLQRPPNAAEIRIRRNFNALAIFSPTIRTDGNGRATARLRLPDNLTRYRITAVAATDSREFGVAESAVAARQLLMIRPSPPRFLNFGDRAEIPVVIQNRTNNPMKVTVAARTVNAKVVGGAGREVVVPANDRAEIRFPVATEAAGIARFQVGAVSGEFADAAEFAFPIEVPATTESFAMYGSTETTGAIGVPVKPPSDIFPNVGGLEVATSSTQLQELTDAFVYLQKYPYECTEQMSSRMLATAALRDVLTAFKSKAMPEKDALDARFQADLDKLRRLQHVDGGWSYWRSDDASIGYVTVHVAHALARAKQKGYAVPEKTLERAAEFLRKTVSSSADRRMEFGGVNEAYALYVLDLLGERDVRRARKLIDKTGVDSLSSESIAWLLAIVAADADSRDVAGEMRRKLLNRVTETAGAAKFVAGYSDRAFTILASDLRTDAVVLEALLRTRSAETDELLPKLVRGMLAGRVRGHWRNTQENVFALLALDRYFAEFEMETPDMLTRIWLDDRFAAQHEFRGRTAETSSVSIPMAELSRKETSNLIVEKTGPGRLYYRIGLNYAPRRVPNEPADFGFEVIRTYEAVDDPSDVRRESDGSWTVRAGSRVRVQIRMVAPADRAHVALVDNLPAGFEIINPDLLTSERLPMRPSDSRGRWYEHLNIRDSRAEAFRSFVPAGIWDLTFVVRATTPGSFTAPPAKAEEMYSPEVFGRTSSDIVNVSDGRR